MVKFKTIVKFYRYHTDSQLVLHFCSLCSAEFLALDVNSKLPGWILEKPHYSAEYNGISYSWEGAGAPKDFTGDWIAI